MSRRKWFPSCEEVTIETTGRYRYVLGVYDHAEYGVGCLRVSKFLRENGYFIGHLVIVPEDIQLVAPKLIDLMESILE